MGALEGYGPLGPEVWPEAVGDMQAGFAGRLDVYRTMAHHPALLRAWGPLRQHVVLDTALGAERSEVVILRTGVRLGSGYEWAHHVVRGRAVGLSDARIASLKGPLEGMAAEDALLAGAVDALFDDKRLSEAQLREVEALVGKEGVFDLIATVGFYSVLGFMLNTCGTEVDGDVAAELAARPLK